MAIVTENDPFDPKKIYDDLIDRCKDAKEWTVRCIVDEAWQIRGPAPFHIKIVDGIFTCRVIAPTLREACLKVVDNLPVIKFLDKYED